MRTLGKILFAVLAASAASGVCAGEDRDRGEAASGAVALIATAKDYLEQRLHLLHPELSRVETAAVGHPRAIGPAPAAARVTPRLARGDALTRRMCVWLDFDVDGRTVKSIPVWFSVAAYRQVPVAGRALRPNALTSSADFILSEIDVAAIGKPAASSIAEVTAKRVRRYIPASSPVGADDFSTPPAVMRHQEVNVQITSGTITIEAKGVSQEDGAIGQVIKIRNPANEAIYLARVANDGRVQVPWRQ